MSWKAAVLPIVSLTANLAMDLYYIGCMATTGWHETDGLEPAKCLQAQKIVYFLSLGINALATLMIAARAWFVTLSFAPCLTIMIDFSQATATIAGGHRSEEAKDECAADSSAPSRKRCFLSDLLGSFSVKISSRMPTPSNICHTRQPSHSLSSRALYPAKPRSSLSKFSSV